ncbi:alkaline phosphatase family protein [Solicola sp. PLA-1-18]|uniref:phage holin family protein n=1 Tax=Solicola sp. PLA-1-18 TaxID=3380532 RepID=UPI003B81542D
MSPSRGPLRRQLQLIGVTLGDWRPTWPRVRGVARGFVTSFLALAVSLWALPGAQVEGATAVASLAVAVLFLGALLRPVLVSLTVLAGSLGMLLAGILAQALVLGLALSIVPGVQPFSWPEIIVASWAAAAVAAGVNWLFDASSDDAFLGQVLGRVVRLAHVHDTPGPGLLVVQLDGVSEPLLRQAITAGAMPTLSRWLRSGEHVLRGWHTGLPATTPAGQAVLLHGDVRSVPSFRWYDKEQGRMVVASHPADVAEVERGLSDGRGLLADGGTSVSNLFSGDAPTRLVTMSDARLPSSDRGAASFFTSRSGFVRSIVLFLGQMVTEWHQGRRQRLRDVQPRVRRGGVFVLLRGLTTVVLRDLNVSIVAEQMARGTRSVFVDFVDYDEVAHHAGPSRPESMRTLEGLDRVLQFFEQVSAEVARDYTIVVVSDHGQSQGATFLQQDGRTLSQVVEALVAGGGSVTTGDDGARPSEPWGPANVLLTGATRSNRVVGAAARSAQRRRHGEGSRDELTVDRRRDVSEPADVDQVVVAASGSLAHVYLADEPGRIARDRIDARCPGLVEGLAAHPGVGLVAVRTPTGSLLVVGADGWRDLRDGEPVDGAGVDPLLPYGPRAAADLCDLDRRDHVGDLVLLGRYDRSLGEVTAFEELVGSHGGLGGEQTQALLVHPSGWDLPGAEESRALTGTEVHAALVGWLDQNGLRTAPPAAVEAPRSQVSR